MPHIGLSPANTDVEDPLQDPWQRENGTKNYDLANVRAAGRRLVLASISIPPPPPRSTISESFSFSLLRARTGPTISLPYAPGADKCLGWWKLTSEPMVGQIESAIIQKGSREQHLLTQLR